MGRPNVSEIHRRLPGSTTRRHCQLLGDIVAILAKPVFGLLADSRPVALVCMFLQIDRDGGKCAAHPDDECVRAFFAAAAARIFVARSDVRWSLISWLVGLGEQAFEFFKWIHGVRGFWRRRPFRRRHRSMTARVRELRSRGAASPPRRYVSGGSVPWTHRSRPRWLRVSRPRRNSAEARTLLFQAGV